MKTKMLMPFYMLGVMLLFIVNCKSSLAQDKYSDEQIKSMLKNFYTIYIAENSKMPVNLEKINSIKGKYCTTKLLNKIENQELNYDPFIKAQDIDNDLLKTLSIKKDSTKNDLYKVTYIDSYNKTTIIINLMIVKEKESYKIDSIW